MSLLKLVGKVALIAYFVLGLLFLGARYWFFPNIDQWRPRIEQHLSDALNANVSLGPIAVDWKGLNPRLRAQDVEFTDTDERSLLEVPSVQATISWRSLFSGQLELDNLEATGLDVTLRRDMHDEVWVMGRSFSLGKPVSSPEKASGVLDWLLDQRQIRLGAATLRWIDEERSAPPLVLEQVNLTLTNQHTDHRFMLQADIPEALGTSLDLRGEFAHTPRDKSAPLDLNEGRGQLYAHVENMHPVGWAPWIDLPQSFRSGQLSVRSWLKFNEGAVQSLTSDIRVLNGHWSSTQYGARAAYVRLFMSGPWDDYQRLLAQDGATPVVPDPDQADGVEYRLLAQALEIEAPAVFELPLTLDDLVSRGKVQRPDMGWQVQAAQLDLASQSLKASLHGNWRQHGLDSAGLIDMQGKITHLSVPAIRNYLPSDINQDARDWLGYGLVAGNITDASLVLQGYLDDFPFNNEMEQGDFRMEGRFADTIIDYLPAQGKEPGWPRLVDMHGRVTLNGADLTLFAEQAVMWPATGKSIQLHDVQARIPDLESDPVLSIAGETTAPASTYLALMTHSPLGEMLDRQFNDSTATGNWDVPLALTIPLMHSRDTTVKGSIRFTDNDVRLTPEMPAYTNVKGTLDFTDTGFATTGLKGQLLGGLLTLEGGVGGAQKGLQMHGTTTASALTDYTGLEGMKRLTGRTAYKASLQQGKGKYRGYILDIHSDLSGMALNFPPPLGKSAGQALPLHITWRRLADGKSASLDVALGDQIKASLLHQEGLKDTAYFHAGALGVNQPLDLPASGMMLDLRYPRVDIDAWRSLITEFSNTLPGVAGTRSQPLLPAVHQVRLQSDKVTFQGAMLDTLTFTASHPEPQQWRVDISSSQTAGTLLWRMANGRIAGHVDASFDRLSLGSEQKKAATAEHEELQFTDELDIPGVNLHIRKFRLYGQNVGELSLTGVNQSRGVLWRLERLVLKSPSAELSGSGEWRLRGANRGLSLDAEARITDLGAYLDQIGQEDVMKAGEGTVKGKLEWHNMPWAFSKSDLDGEITFNLSKGRFSMLNSYSARLLELLSLQSVKRLARLDFNPAGLTKEGFPYDELLGTVTVGKGLMRTSNYRVIGPVGTIVIGGDINLVSKLLNLEAVVIPNLDISGAAVAAGIAINPIVGVGAFLTQWLLQAPLAKAMTVQYQINGAWDDPKITEISGSSTAARNDTPAEKPARPRPKVEPQRQFEERLEH
ncbi:TIGR02099 family protein [Pusillimonas sp. MFBS29]|uniref:YhdP family protein n=1 Tax=Pusillimonas sp. MFBS29 TaxID=2886690 RepID=UPI001D1083FC|nr:YhdP family protein [Pusillimonas sp. MFBS29]MCC2595306.1 TIGR02099 family protein [Pusillimonas sp. MFBS29]